MNEKTPPFNTGFIRKTILIISGCVLGMAVLASGAYVLQLLRTQKLEIESLSLIIKNQEPQISGIASSMKSLTQSLEEIKTKGSVQQKTLDEATQAIRALETAHASLKADTEKTKNNKQESMKEYLVSIGNLEAKIDLTATAVDSLENDILNNDKEISLLKDQVSSLKNILNKIVEAIPTSSSSKASIQKSLHPELFM